MKKIFKALLPLLVVLLIFPSIGKTNVNPNEELTNLINIIETDDAGSDIILPNLYQETYYHTSTPIELARGGSRGGGSFRSSPSRSRSGGSSGWGSGSKSRNSTKSTPKKKSTWGTKKKDNISGSRNKKNTITKKSTAKKTAVKKTTKRKLSKADKKLAEKAKKSGKYHKTRKAAREDFKKKNAKKYTSKYATKPATRPAHIPQSTMVNGVSVNIGYNAGFGGYGYMGVGGRWIMYDMMSDMVMMDMMMNRTGYVVASDLGRPVPIRGPGYFLLNFLYLIIVLIVLYGIVHAIKRSGEI